jgi:hypothetical protein
MLFDPRSMRENASAAFCPLQRRGMGFSSVAAFGSTSRGGKYTSAVVAAPGIPLTPAAIIMHAAILFIVLDLLSLFSWYTLHFADADSL